MVPEEQQHVWIFTGVPARYPNFPSGVFATVTAADEWIRRHSLSGILTEYTVDEGAFDEAVDRGLFVPATADQTTPEFIETFAPVGHRQSLYDSGHEVSSPVSSAELGTPVPSSVSDVWVFNGSFAYPSVRYPNLPSGVFSTLDRAEKWIAKHALSGTLTRYPVDQGVFDWALARGFFAPKKPAQGTPVFIANFSSASQEHYHYPKSK